MAVAFVASADMLDYMTRAHVKSEAAPTHVAATPAKVGDELDKTPTASVLPRVYTRSVLDPCTGVER